MHPQRVILFDTTLRDGIGGFETPPTVEEKLKIARALVGLRVDVIEAGFPGAHPEDADGLRAIAREVKGSQLAALARATGEDVEAAARALEGAAAARIHIFIATGPAEKDPNPWYDRTAEAIRHARRYFDDIEFSPHNATRTREDVLAGMIRAAVEAGAGTINISDTLGYALPDEMSALIHRLQENVAELENAVMSVHCHNDLGLATANSLAALQAGARQVECSVNGIGERAGNAAMEEIVMALKARRDLLGLDCGVDASRIQQASDLVSRISGHPVPPGKALVGEKALEYAPAVLRNGFQKSESYAIIKAGDIGRNAPGDD